MVTCPLCGFSFDEALGKSSCRACPIGAGCRWVCCPNCGYSLTPGRDVLARPRTLSTLPAGAEREIGDLDRALGAEGVSALVSLGLVPGARVRVVRSHPTLMVRIGNRTLALDRGLAEGVLVRGSDMGDGMTPGGGEIRPG